MTVTLDKHEQRILTRLLSAAIGNTLFPEKQISPKVNTGLEFEFLIDILGKVNGMEARNEEAGK